MRKKLSKKFYATIRKFKMWMSLETCQSILQSYTVRQKTVFERKIQNYLFIQIFTIFLFVDKEKMMKFLIEAKPEIVNATNGWEHTPLFYAAAGNGKILLKK